MLGLMDDRSSLGRGPMPEGDVSKASAMPGRIARTLVPLRAAATSPPIARAVLALRRFHGRRMGHLDRDAGLRIRAGRGDGGRDRRGHPAPPISGPEPADRGLRRSPGARAHARRLLHRPIRDDGGDGRGPLVGGAVRRRRPARDRRDLRARDDPSGPLLPLAGARPVRRRGDRGQRRLVDDPERRHPRGARHDGRAAGDVGRRGRLRRHRAGDRDLGPSRRVGSDGADGVGRVRASGVHRRRWLGRRLHRRARPGRRGDRDDRRAPPAPPARRARERSWS